MAAVSSRCWSALDCSSSPTYLQELIISLLYPTDVLLVLDLQLMKVYVVKSISHIILLSKLALHLRDQYPGTTSNH